MTQASQTAGVTPCSLQSVIVGFLCTLQIKLASLNLQYRFITVDPETNQPTKWNLLCCPDKESNKEMHRGGRVNLEFRINRYTLLFIK